MNKTEAKSFILKPNKSLINPQFDGYKLKQYSDLYTLSFMDKFNGYKQVQSDVGYLHTKLISMHNHLHPDPFNTLIAFAFDSEYKLHLFSLEELNSSSKVLICIETDFSGKTSNFIVPPTITFPSETLALTSNGFNQLKLYETTEHRSTDWKLLLKIPVENSIISHSLLHERSGELHVLLLSIVNLADLKNDSSLQNLDFIFKSNKEWLSLCKVEWLALAMRDGEWAVCRKRILVGSGAVEFLALTPKCDEIVLLCKERYSFVYDSMATITPITEPQNIVTCLFKQCSKSITIWIKVTDIDLGEVETVLSSGLELIHGGRSLFNRKFSRDVCADPVLKKLDGQIEVYLTKTEDLLWDFLFKDCNENVIEIADMEKAREEKVNVAVGNMMMMDEESEKPAYNCEQLEDCDINSEEAILSYMDGESHSCSKFSILNSAEPLFTTVSHSPSASGFCMRHDVDGLLWTLDGSPQDPIHTATFSAFGYVKASKTMAKYTSVPTDNSYVAVCDVRCHLYVFCQSRKLEGVLRNRRTGALVPYYDEQLVISLKNPEEVIGIHTAKEGILVLNQDKVTFYSLPINT